MTRLRRLAPSGMAGLLARFATSGLLNSLVYVGVFLLASHALGASASISSCLGYLAGLAVGFMLHRRYTFATSGKVSGELLRYLLAQAATMAVLSVVSHVGADLLAWPGWLVILSGVAIAPPLNFLLLYGWVFRNSPANPAWRPDQRRG